MTSPLNTLVFGGCLLRGPLRNVPDLASRLACEPYSPGKAVHSFGEMFQIIEVMQAQRDVPAALRHLTSVPEDLGPVAGADTFAGLDVALIEPASPVELIFRGVFLNRTRIAQVLLKPLRERGGEFVRMSAKWLRVGLVGRNETVRVETASQMLRCITGDRAEDELARAVIGETCAVKTDIGGGFRKMQALIGCPIGAVIYVFNYMPDGRPVHWPAGLSDEVLAATREMDLPVFDPVPLVQSYGPAEALMRDLSHYNDAFLPVVGEALVQFALSVHARARHRTCASAPQ